MPIIDVTLVVAPHATLAPDLAQRLADAVGGALRSPPGQAWVRLHVLARDRFAENRGAQEFSELPVFVAVTQRQLPQISVLEQEVSALTDAIAQATARPPASVHIEFAPAALGRMAFGGTLVE